MIRGLFPLRNHFFSSQGEAGRKGEKGETLEVRVYMERFRVSKIAASKKKREHFQNHISFGNTDTAKTWL